MNFRKLFLSLVISLLTLGLIFQLVARGTGEDASVWPLFRDLSPLFLVVYVLCQLGQTLLRSERYRILLKGSDEPLVPSSLDSFWATMARNALVDLLPARAGELGYLALMNLNYRVRADTCVGSMAISFLFDIVALAAVLVLAVVVPGTRDLATWPILLRVSGALTLICVVGLWGMLVLLPRYIQPFWHRVKVRFPFKKAGEFIDNTLLAVARVRDGRVLLLAFVLSVGVRVFKYGGLFFLFKGITRVHLPELAFAEARHVLPALLAGEAAAALPLPTLMGFGIYEGGATAMWSVLGFSASAALLAMLAVHVVSQMVDYSLGGVAFLAISWRRRSMDGGARRTRRGRCVAIVALVGIALVGALGFAVHEWRAIRKRGSLEPPAIGAAVALTTEQKLQRKRFAESHRGRLVWSSNRYGNHDILMMEWPSLEIKRLTNHPHTETYPRISPDGKKMLFARSQLPWVSQRDAKQWDTWLLDLENGKESLLATNAFSASWIDDTAIIFARAQEGSIVRLDLVEAREKTLLRGGQAPVKSGTALQTPYYDVATDMIAATLRGEQRITGVLDHKGTLRRVSGGGSCQILWGRPGELIYVSRGGRQKNAIHRYDLETDHHEIWLDLPGEFSHEYFPKLANNGKVLVFGASAGGHEHDTADYEIFVWDVSTNPEKAVRMTFHSGNDCWPDIWLLE